MELKIEYYFRPECGREGRLGRVFGPYPECLQLTYANLRETSKGEEVAYLHTDGDWRIVGEPENEYWSDLVLYAQIKVTD